MKNKLIAMSVFSTLISSQAIAHSGDHSTGSVMSAIWHQITEPDHLLMAGLVAAIIFGGVRAFKNKKA